MAATKAAQGMVSTQAQTISRALPQRTALRLCVEPTPAIAPAMAWVVETGRPRKVGKRIEMAAPVSAQKPPHGLRRVRPEPMVLTIFQPPLMVPRLMAILAQM